MRGRWSVAVLALSLLSAGARADVNGSIEPGLRLGAGYDDNLFLDARPTGTLPSQVRSDAIFDVEPSLGAALAAGHSTLQLDVDDLERLTVSNGNLRDLNARLAWASPPLGPVRFLIDGLYEHYYAWAFPEDTFDLGGGEAGLRLGFRRLELAARYRFDARAYPDPLRSGQLDLEQRAAVSLRLHLHARLDGELAYSYLHIGSNDPTAELDRHRGDVLVEARPARWLSLAAAYGIAWQALPAAEMLVGPPAPRDDLLQEVSLSATARPLSWLALFVRYDFVYSSSSTPSGQWQRNQVVGGLALSLALAHRFHRPPPEAPRLDGERVTFRFRGRATRVSVVGDWNGWDPQAQPLAPDGGGRFQATYTVPPGRHEYALSVDGATVAPPDAPRYAPDGFGGKNGVIEVP